MSKRLKSFWPVLLGIILSAIFYYKIFIPHQILRSDDIIGIFSFEKWFFAQQIVTQHIFSLWNPYLFGGVPFVGNPSPAMFYPINWLFLLFSAHTDSVFGYIFVLDAIGIFCFTYLFTKTIGLRIWSRIVSSIIFTFSLPITVLVFPGHVFIADAIVWFPCLLWLYERYVQQQQFVDIVWAGVVIGLSFLTGNTQIAVYSLMIGFLYSFLRKPTNYKNPKFVLNMLLSVIIGGALASVAISPSMEFTKYSIRSQGLPFDFAASLPFHPYYFITYIFPYVFGSPINQTMWLPINNFHGAAAYIGILPLFFVVYALCDRWNRYIFVFFCCLLFALLFSMGSLTPVFHFFYSFIPGFTSFRVPARMLYIIAFCLSMLAGFGVEKFLYAKKIKKYIVVLVMISASSLLCMYLLLSNPHALSWYEHIILKNNSRAIGIDHKALFGLLQQDIFRACVLTFSLLIIFFTKKKSIQFTTAILVTIIFVDLFIVGNNTIVTDIPQNIYKHSAMYDFLKKDTSTFRVFDLSGETFYDHEKDGLEHVMGIHSMQVRDSRDFLWLVGPHVYWPYDSFFLFKNKIEHTQILDLFNIKYIISNVPLSNPSLNYINTYNDFIGSSNATKKYYLYQNTNVLPRAYIVGNVVFKKTRKDVYSELLKDSFDPKKNVILESTPLASSYETQYQPISHVQATANTVDLTFELAHPGFMVLSDVWFPGWKAFDNEKEIPIYKANGNFRGLFVKAGKHHIYFVYQPVSFYVGLAISLATLIAIIFYFLFQKKILHLFNLISLRYTRLIRYAKANKKIYSTQ